MKKMNHEEVMWLIHHLITAQPSAAGGSMVGFDFALLIWVSYFSNAIKPLGERIIKYML